jgi:hypothetical protein
MDWQERSALLLVGIAATIFAVQLYRRYFAGWIAAYFLKKGRVKLAFMLRSHGEGK